MVFAENERLPTSSDVLWHQAHYMQEGLGLSLSLSLSLSLHRLEDGICSVGARLGRQPPPVPSVSRSCQRKALPTPEGNSMTHLETHTSRTGQMARVEVPKRSSVSTPSDNKIHVIQQQKA